MKYNEYENLIKFCNVKLISHLFDTWMIKYSWQLKRKNKGKLKEIFKKKFFLSKEYLFHGKKSLQY